MGARVYIPVLGRFLSVDSVEGRTDNNYVYANDPVNQFDLDGKAIPIIILAGLYIGGIAWSAYQYHKSPTKENAFWLGVSFIPGGGLAGGGSKVLKYGLNAIGGAKMAKTAVYTAQKAYNCSKTQGCVQQHVASIRKKANNLINKIPTPIKRNMKIITKPYIYTPRRR